MSANDNSNKLYWLAYCQIFKDQIGNFGDSNAIFYCTKSQRGPPVECPDSYTNYGIIQMANNLLAADNLFYAPSAGNTYLDALKSYLSWVDVGGNPTDAQKIAVINAKKTYDACKIAVDREFDLAVAEYQKYSKLGVIPDGQKLIDWLPLHADAYNNAKLSYDEAGGTYTSAVLGLNGPLSSQWAAQLNRLTQASNSFDHYLNGINKATSSSTPPSISDILNAQTAGTTLPAPTDIVYLPDYGCPNYATVAKAWEDTALKPPAKTNSFTLDLNKASSISESSFGQTKIGGNLGFSYEGIIGFGFGGSSDHKEETLDTTNTGDDISITLWYDDLQKVDITPGVWNVSNPKGSYPNLKPGAPDSAKILVRPSQLVLVNKLGYTIKFSSTIAKTFDKKVSDVKTASGYVSIFGIPIFVGGSYTSENVVTTHTGSWDSSSGTFTVNPTQDAGFATIIAIVGEKVQTF